MRRIISWIVLSTASLVLAGCAGTQATGREPFTLVLLPDTQYYSRQYPAHFKAQTQWIREHQSELNIAFVSHLGDITDGSSEREWQVADEAMSALDGVVPYGLVVGNHDFDGTNVKRRATTNFDRHFGVARFKDRPWYGGHMSESNANNWQTFSAGGMKFLVLNLEFGPTDDIVAWANEVIASHPDRRVILCTHGYMYHDETRLGKGDSYNPHNYDTAANDGEELWTKLVAPNPNVHFVFSGHVLGDGLGLLTSDRPRGRPVHQVLVNYQMRPEGGRGFLRIMRFVPPENRVYCTSYSPVLDEFINDGQNEFALDYDMSSPGP